MPSWGRLWGGLLDRFAPLATDGRLSATLDGKPWCGGFAWVDQLNGPSYTIPCIDGTLVVTMFYRRRLLGYVLPGGRRVVVRMWLDGTDASARLLGGVLVP